MFCAPHWYLFNILLCALAALLRRIKSTTSQPSRLHHRTAGVSASEKSPGPHGCRYYVTQEWVAKKLEALVDVSEELDLEWLRGRGPQPDEQLQPEDAQASTAPAASAAGQLRSAATTQTACMQQQSMCCL